MHPDRFRDRFSNMARQLAIDNKQPYIGLVTSPVRHRNQSLSGSRAGPFVFWVTSGVTKQVFVDLFLSFKAIT